MNPDLTPDMAQPLHPQDVGLILSYRCQSRCKHCLYSCGPDWQDWISTEDLRSALTTIASLGSNVQVHITGGEPFLNFTLALKAIEIAAELGIRRYIETNAGWCVRPDLVWDRFSALRDAGLQLLLISCSPFHAESIPPRFTLMAIDIALQVFGPKRVLVYLPDWIDHVGRFGTQEAIPLERYIQAYGRDPAGLLFWEGYELISGGRAGYTLGHLTDCHPVTAFRYDDCLHEIVFAHHSHFDLYGNYISGFCGGLSIGDWHQLEELQASFTLGKYPPLITLLTERGPYGLYRYAAEEYGYQPLAYGYAGKCHLCVDVRRHLSRQADFPELSPRGFYQFLE